MANPYLLFEFPNEQGHIQPLAFLNPVKVLKTTNLDEIPKLMDSLETAVKAGYYAAGYVSYEAAPAFNPKMKVHSQSDLPLVWFGLFEKPGVAEENWDALEEYSVSEWQMAGSIQQYQEGIRKIKQAIEEGHTYQVNYTERLHAQFQGSDRAFYRQLARNQQSSYSAYLDFGKDKILSASPELFFRIDGQKITARPMKGTAPRGRVTAEDERNVDRLLTSEKERAENLMIVDLLRNDISRLAKSGTVTVPRMFEAEKYPTVHQLTSTVQAEINKELTVFDWFRALFPCGSITGAPKISTMEFIAELEQSPREVYCGAIGFITPEKDALFNVPIRTVVIDGEKGTASYGVGGGVTWDSTSEGEYKELLTKAQVLSARRPVFKLLESLKLEDGVYPLRSYHVERLRDSASYFSFNFNKAAIDKLLDQSARNYPKGLFKIRLLMDRSGELSIDAQTVSPLSEPLVCSIATSPVDSSDPFLFHKTTHRHVYDEHQKAAPPEAFSVLLWNEQEELTEFTIGNIVAEKDGKFYTPPVSCGLLPGTLRQHLLQTGKIEEKRLLKKDLDSFDAIWFINSVRGWLKVDLLNQ
ncbi:para-aminobenzoate synthetase/4-amino-4-deoxychorismate lyase [Planomicrobium soli]|uniref:Para-aminobenzoate synthetase/4-amino-4-deoxychorismate lyase n=1 Tax=Planomicrobium soli TaxID=1176648 RepID=A0A2P8H7Q4_9BACL|nr:aminodeoxychorismate synthase component I [Planomicrobium soli]PSL42224.1 para-aminobenzoate synthetase/4-amino-4-deoxychorismate lyase [Planomicrobium soli]